MKTFAFMCFRPFTGTVLHILRPFSMAFVYLLNSILRKVQILLFV